MFNTRVFVLLAFGCLATAAWAADDPMVGDWKLKPQKSRIIDEMKVTSLGGTRYAFDFGGGVPENILVDGTDQPGMAGTTLAVTATPDSWTVVRKKDGKALLKATWTVSKDGATLKDDYTQFGDDGKPIHIVYRYDRKGGGAGFAGDWLSTTQRMDTAYVMQVRPYEGDRLSITAEGTTRNLKLDGKEYPGTSKMRSASAQRGTMICVGLGSRNSAVSPVGGTHNSEQWVPVDVLEGEIDEMGLRIDCDRVRMRHMELAELAEITIAFLQNGDSAGFR
jgi:hypothetical protein